MDIAKYVDYFDVSNEAASSGVFLSGICLVLLAIGTIVGILMKNEKLELILGVCTGKNADIIILHLSQVQQAHFYQIFD